jgi:hypothetical protein
MKGNTKMPNKIDFAELKARFDNFRDDQVDVAKTRAFFDNLHRANDSNKDHQRQDDVKKTPFMPYVMMRTLPGDKGARPLPEATTFWESPDIWTFPAPPNTAPDIPPAIYQPLKVGEPNTVYAHIWNLGRAPIAGVRVEWYWFNPSLGFSTPNAHLIGIARIDLAPRGLEGCHKLVKCPTAWVPVMENGGHECIVARVSAFGDPLKNPDEWLPLEDRHVAQRNITVVTTNTNLSKLIESLNLTKPANSMTRLFQLGVEATPLLHLVAPHLKIDTSVKTHLLAELSQNGVLLVSPIKEGPPRVMPHMLLNLGNPPATKGAQPLANVKLDQPLQLHTNATVTDLLHHGSFLHPDVLKQIETLSPPKKSEAQVLRVVSYQGDKAVGGYTIVVSA